MVIGAAGLALFFGLHRLGARALWFDEAFSFAVAELEGPRLIRAVTQGDPSMGLYYTILHFWLPLGDSEATIRTLSVIFGVVSVPLIFLVGKELFDEQVGAVAAVLLAVNRFFVEQSQEARGYSLALLLVTLSTLLLIRAVRGGGKVRWALYAVVSVLSVLAHAFSLFILIAHAASTLVFRARPGRRVKLMFIALGVLAAGAIAAAPVLRLVIGNERWTWIRLPAGSTVAEEVGALFGQQGWLLLGYLFLVCVAAALFVQALVNRVDGDAGWSLALPLACFFVPVVGSLLGSFVVPMFVLRYLTIALPGLILCVAVGVTKIGPRWLSIAVFITVFALSAASLNRWYEHPPEYKDGPWREASTFLLSKVHDGDTVLFDSEASAILFNYYSRSLPDEPLRLEFPYLPPVLNDGESASLPVAGVGALKEQTPLPRRVWVLLGGTFMPTSGRFLSEGMGDRYRPGGIGIAFSYARMQLYRKTRPSHHERTR